jgi:hypothetical protein
MEAICYGKAAIHGAQRRAGRAVQVTDLRIDGKQQLIHHGSDKGYAVVAWEGDHLVSRTKINGSPCLITRYKRAWPPSAGARPPQMVVEIYVAHVIAKRVYTLASDN